MIIVSLVRLFKKVRWVDKYVNVNIVSGRKITEIPLGKCKRA